MISGLGRGSQEIYSITNVNETTKTMEIHTVHAYQMVSQNS